MKMDFACSMKSPLAWHHSHLADLWRVIFRVCKERNHQIIATTHSDEGVTAFVQAAEAEKAEDECCYIRLDPAQKRRSAGESQRGLL